MTRFSALLLFAGLFLAAPVPAHANWATNLIHDGQNAVSQGKKDGNPLEVIGGAIEQGLGALFGGGHHGNSDSSHNNGHGQDDQNHGGQSSADGGSQQGGGGDGGGPLGHTVNGTTIINHDPAPTSGTPNTPTDQNQNGSNSDDSTSLVKHDSKTPNGQAGGAPQGPQITYNGGSSIGGLVAVHSAMGHMVTGDASAPQAEAAAPQVTAPDASGAATQSGEASAAAQKKDTLLDKVVAPIAGVGDQLGRQIANLIANAKAKIALGDFKGAIADLSKAIALDPTNPRAWIGRAEAYNRLKQYDLARADALQALKLDPNSSAAYEQLAFADYKLGHLKDALAEINHALQLNPNDATAYWIRALIEAKMGDMAAALRDLETAANLNPKFRDAWEKARESGRVVDPDDESSLGDEALRVGLGLPIWAWMLIALFVLVGATIAGVLALRAPKAAPVPALARAIVQDPDKQGRLAGKYELKNLIGKGGMGNVYEAIDHSLGRSVAIKKMSERLADMAPQARQMLVQEAKTVAQLHHPAVVDIYEILEDEGDLYLVFELVKGKTALHLLAESNGKLGLPRTLEILRPVCDALEFAHGRGMIHRDLKPANVMITEAGHVKLMDFGIARSLTDTSPAPAAPGADASIQKDVPAFAQTRTVVGTPQYMAPEIEQGIVSRQGDVYALGVCLYEMTTGRLPFTDRPQKLGLQMLVPSQLNPALPKELDDLVVAALQPDPNARLGSAKEFLARLEKAAAAAAAAPAKA